MRPFWCQLEAVETVIWLLEAGPVHARDSYKEIRRRISNVNTTYNSGIPRLALKLATGTGKTLLMAMIALWWTARRDEPSEFLALTPNLTVKDRLQALDPSNPRRSEDRMWDSVVPRGFERHLRRMNWTILNFQQFQRRTGPDGMGAATAKEKKFIHGGLGEPETWKESEPAMLNRLLRSHRADRRLIVINDEAHHCYAPVVTKEKQGADEKEAGQAAALWYSALRAMHDAGRLEQVFDLSATPMWMRKPVDLDSEIFPWTGSDVPLLDAIESGLVKIPRVPVADNLNIDQPRYRNIYEFAKGKDCRKGELQPKIREPLEQLYRHYETKVNPHYEAQGILPILIVVANKIKNAEILHRWIAGEQRTDNVWTPGNLPLLSNVNPDGTPKQHPPTVLVHSKLADPDPLTGKLGKAIEEQAVLLAPEAKTKKERQEAVHDIFTTAGRKGEPGEYVRCVISVGMLTEGWDARNVTHIFGYRRFGSLLLCEQVTGRALRRTSFSGRDARQAPEHANIFGVPYSFARGTENGPPRPPTQPWRVHSVEGRQKFRIVFPNVVGYEEPSKVIRWRLNPTKAKAFQVAKQPTPETTLAGGGAGDSVEVIRRDERAETDMWRAAAQVAIQLARPNRQRRMAFADALQAVREWIALPQIDCPEIAGLQSDAPAIRAIAEACERQEEDPPRIPVFADTRDGGTPRLISTANVDFETTLPHRWTATHSELNAAACHTKPEVQLARILDEHLNVDAWARNFRLGWEIPWFDTDLDNWRRTEPDFVATSRPRDGQQPLNLVIEFKGLKAGEQSEEEKRLWLGRWAEAITKYHSGEEDYGAWRVVWIENIKMAGLQIDDAISGSDLK